MIILLPTSSEPVGVAAQRFAELGYTLQSRRGRIVATPLSTNVVAIRKPRMSIVSAVFDFAKRDQ